MAENRRSPGPRPLTALPSVWVLCLGFAALHLMLSLLVPLVEDEAYYALWATVPSAGYYDHPPVIAWMIAAGEALFGTNRFGVRFFSVAAFAAVTPMVWRMAWLASGEERVARMAALFYNATALALILGFTATPDAPSTFFWALTAWAVTEAIAAPDRATRWWWLAGLGAGLGVLSKFTNLFLWVGLTLWLIGSREGRQALKRPVVWAAAGLALLVLVPFALWNDAHHWVGLTRQFGRVGAGHGAEIGGLALFLALVVLEVTPGIAYGALRGLRPGTETGRFQIWLTAPLVLYMAYHALHTDVQANWLIPIFPGLAVLAALGARRWRAGAVWAAAGGAMAVASVVFALALWPGTAIFPGHNPPNETKGWPRFLTALRATATQNGAQWIATTHYGLTGSLAFYLPRVPVWSITAPERYLFRGAIPQHLCKAPGLLVTVGEPSAATLGRFTRTGHPVLLKRTAGGAVLDSYTATPVQGLLPCAATN